MNSLKALVGAAALALLANGGASAASHSLTGCGGGGYSSLGSSFSVGDLTFAAGSFTDVSVSGNTITSASYASDPRIACWSHGAGVYNSPNDGSHTVDGTGWKDYITISSATAFTIDSATFGWFDLADDFRWMYDSNNDGVIGAGDYISDSINVAANNPFMGFGGVTSDLFAIGAFDDAQSCGGSKKKKKKKKKCEDSWKLKAVKTTVVPLPAGLPLLLGGIVVLGGIGVARRKV